MKPNLIEFIRRNRSHSPSDGCLMEKSKVKDSLLTKSQTSFAKKTQKMTPQDPPDLTQILLDIKEKLKKIESTSLYLEKWKEDLLKKEEDLKQRQKIMQENEKAQKKTAKKLKEVQKALQYKEEALRKQIKQEKESMLQEVNQTFQKKILEIQQKESQLANFLRSIQQELETLEKAKDEIIQLECSALLNEVISTIYLQDYQEQIFQLQSSYPSSQNSPKFGVFDPIEEASNESSQEFSDLYSLKYMKNHESILQECDEISKENKEITDKLEALMATLKLE